jgi:DNA-binding XRE family transcriptional regulator
MDAVPFCGWARLTVKAQKQRDYSEDPQTLGEHLKKRRKELGLLQRETAVMLGVSTDTVVNWEKDRTKPIAAQFRPVVTFLGYDPTSQPQTLAERVEAKQRSLGASLAQVARHLGWDPGSLRRYLDGTWRISTNRRDVLEAFLKAEDTALASLHSLKRRR